MSELDAGPPPETATDDAPEADAPASLEAATDGQAGLIADASTNGVEAEYALTDAWCLAVTLAVEGDETQTGFSYRIARGLDELDWEAVADEAVERGARMLGAAKPTTARVPFRTGCSSS